MSQRFVKIVISCVLLTTALPVIAQNTASASTAPVGVIRGTVKSGNTPLPGVTITAANTLTGKKVITSTDLDGSYSISAPSKGRYVVRAELSAFNTATKEVVVNSTTPNSEADLEMVLLSRVVNTENAPEAQAALGRVINPATQARGARRLNVDESLSAYSAGTSGSDIPLQGMPALASAQEATNDSVSFSGSMGQTQNMGNNIDDVRDRIDEMRAHGDFGGDGGRIGGPGGNGGPDGGPAAIMIGGPGGMRGGGFGRGRRGFNVNTIHGSAFYNLGNAALDAAPYALSGLPEKPDYSSNRFGASIGGPLKIPKLLDLSKSNFFFLDVSGTRATNPYTAFSRVPTQAERNGQFSNLTIPSSEINPIASDLLRFIPLPNTSGDKNYVYSTSSLSNSTNIAFRIMHNSGGLPMLGRGGGGGGPRMPTGINLGFNYSNATSNLVRPFPTMSGKSTSQGFNGNLGYTISHGKWTNNFRATFNQSRTRTLNIYAGVQNVAGELGCLTNTSSNCGIPGVSASPLDWGLPSISFSSSLQGIGNIASVAQRSRTLNFSDFIIWRRGKHNIRFGGDFRRMWIDANRDPNPTGTFTFSSANGVGNDFANFLLGLPAQETIQYAMNSYAFEANGWDLFLTDDWRVTKNLTLNLGLRYEYVAPFNEADNLIANLAVTPGFTSVVPVLPGQLGYSSALVNPDRNNWAPRIGIAWKPFSKTVVRAGYGINYNLGQYRSIVQQLAANPGLPSDPFSFTQTLTATPTAPLFIQNGFAANGTISNTYGIDPNYRLGYVQMWNLNVQREIGSGTVVNVGYTGSKGTALDMVRAPDPTVAGVAPFLWETSQGFSIMHAGSVRVRKRMQHGLAIGGTYTFSKSIDNASSIGGGATVVAQNDLDLAAERGLSSFDQRHRFTGDWSYNLPFGEGQKWLASGGKLSRILGGWGWNGSFTIASGLPFTARVLGNTAALVRGANGSLRADYNGLPISLPNPGISEWFNTAAFTSPCAVAGGVQTCALGTAGRNTIIGPGTLSFNMSMAKNIPIRDTMGFEIRADATNVFNTPQYTSIDTVVNSRTFGQVVAVGNMRQIKLSMRFRF